MHGWFECWVRDELVTVELVAEVERRSMEAPGGITDIVIVSVGCWSWDDLTQDEQSEVDAELERCLDSSYGITWCDPEEEDDDY